MRRLRDRLGALTADEYLRLALYADSPAAAAVLAEKGLEGANALDPEVTVLLLREVFRAHLAAHRVRSAHAIARKMVRLDALREITHADLGRSCAALGWWVPAAQAYRVAARHAPARRRSIHWASVANALHHAGHYADALSALERATRWALTTRELHRACAALVRIDSGLLPQAIEDLEEITHELECARCGAGFGRYVTGLLYAAQGDSARAIDHLRQFIRRNGTDPMRSAALAAELTRARRTLRTLRQQHPPETPPPPVSKGPR